MKYQIFNQQQKATLMKIESEKPKHAKITGSKKSAYEDLPEIPDYERPELEKYEKSDFDPSKKVR